MLVNKSSAIIGSANTLLLVMHVLLCFHSPERLLKSALHILHSKIVCGFVVESSKILFPEFPENTLYTYII
jgi:hypothetical protein